MTTTRPYETADDEAIVALMKRVDVADGLIDTVSLERWRELVGIARMRGGRDFRVVTRGSDVVAVLISGHLQDSRIASGVRRLRVFVDPALRRQGIASALLEVAEAQCRAEGASVVEGFVLAPWTAGCAFARARGFDVLVHDLFMRRGTDAFDARVPDAVRIRAYVPGQDDDAWVSVANDTLASDIGFHPETVASLRGYAQATGFALWVAEAGGALVGFCHVQDRGEVSYVHALGVRHEHEGRGIGAALLSRGIDTLRVAPHVRAIELCTEKPNVRAQRLYARAGFTLHREALTFRKTLR